MQLPAVVSAAARKQKPTGQMPWNINPALLHANVKQHIEREHTDGIDSVYQLWVWQVFLQDRLLLHRIHVAERVGGSSGGVSPAQSSSPACHSPQRNLFVACQGNNQPARRSLTLLSEQYPDATSGPGTQDQHGQTCTVCFQITLFCLGGNCTV